MGNSSKKLMQQMQQMISTMLQPAIQAQQQESPYLTRLGQDATGFLDQVKSGDLRGIKTGTFWNMDSLANRNKQRSLVANSAAQGQGALGTPNASLLALDRANRDAETEHDYNSEFQDQIGQQTANAKNALMGLGSAEEQRKAGVTGSLSGLFGQIQPYTSQQASKPSWWSSLLQSGLSAAPGIAASFI